MTNSLGFLDSLLLDLRKRGDPIARANKDALRRSGAIVDPRPATDPWEDRPWVPTSLVIRTHMQHCLSCDSTAETLVGYFLRSEAPDGGGRIAARLQRVECAHPGLPEIIETSEEQVRACPLCIRLERLLGEARPHQLTLFATSAIPSKA